MLRLKIRARRIRDKKWYYGDSEKRRWDWQLTNEVLPMSLFWSQVEAGRLDAETICRGAPIEVIDREGEIRQAYENDFHYFDTGDGFFMGHIIFGPVPGSETDGWVYQLVRDVTDEVTGEDGEMLPGWSGAMPLYVGNSIDNPELLPAPEESEVQNGGEER